MALGDYLSQHKRLAKIPGAVLRIQRWYQMCRVWRRYRRFLRAIKQFRGRGFRICFRAWQIMTVAEVNCRSVVLGRIIVAWRVTSRNAAVWDEESAVLFLETSRAGGCPQQVKSHASTLCVPCLRLHGLGYIARSQSVAIFNGIHPMSSSQRGFPAEIVLVHMSS